MFRYVHVSFFSFFLPQWFYHNWSPTLYPMYFIRKKNLCDPDFLSMCYHCKSRAIFWIFDLAELTFNIHVLIDIRLCYITLLSFSSIGARVDSNQICLVRPVWKKGAKNSHATLIVRNLFLHLVNGDLSNFTICKTIFVFNSK